MTGRILVAFVSVCLIFSFLKNEDSSEQQGINSPETDVSVFRGENAEVLPSEVLKFNNDKSKRLNVKNVLLRSSSKKTISWPHATPLADRNEAISIDAEVLVKLTEGSKIRLKFFDDADFKGVVQSNKKDINGTNGIVLKLEGYEEAFAFISITDGKVLANTHLPFDVNYGIRYLEAEGSHFSIEYSMKSSDNLSCGEEILGGITLEQGAESETVLGSNTDTLIEIMILYTPEAKNWATQNEGGINNTVNQAVSRARTAHSISQTGVNLNLVHSAQVSYTESGSSGTDLSRLRYTNDGHLDSIHSLRTNKGADLVSFFTKVSDTGGLGYLYTGSSGLGFNITRVQQASWTYTMVHEFGHNMGCGHHSDQSTQPGPGSFSYASGWRWPSYRSVMAYSQNGDARTAHFSNPDVNHTGYPTGNSTHDNVRCIEATKGNISNFRATVSVPETDLVKIFWRSTTGSVNYWFLNNDGTRESGGFVHDTAMKSVSGWECLGLPDIDSDGTPDILWRSTSGSVNYWLLNNDGSRKRGGFVHDTAMKSVSGWECLGLPDIDSDGTPDILWRSTSGSVNYWLLNNDGSRKRGGFVHDTAMKSVSGWECLGLPDIDSDGTPDILWRSTSGSVNYWLLNNDGSRKRGGFVHDTAMKSVSGWECLGLPDIDSDENTRHIMAFNERKCQLLVIKQ